MTDEALVSAILAREGSVYTDDPADPGGPTKYGVTIPALAALRDCDPAKITAKDIEDLDEFTARQVYHRILEGDTLVARCAADPLLCELVLDMVVNHGHTKAIVLVQRALGVTDDGVAGPATVKALETAVALNSRDFTREVLIARVLFRASHVKAVPASVRFLKGWLARDMAFVRKFNLGSAA